VVDGKLKAFLTGQGAPADVAAQVRMAALAQQPFNQLYATAARLYRDAFARQPRLTEAHRYNAACCAALAGCGQGKDAGRLDAGARGGWRRQALTWLRADLAARARQSKGGPDRQARQVLESWRHDTDLAGVRDDKALAKLPLAERREWLAFWADVKTLLERPSTR
jgi:hypothetical protein